MLSDSSGEKETLRGGVLSPGQERWFTFEGFDNQFVTADPHPEATLSTSQSGTEVCIFISCLGGHTDVVCRLGTPATVEGLSGCCSTQNDVQVVGGTLGLCNPDMIHDDAFVYVRVALPASAAVCTGYDLTVHY
jgi:hypothetical protein